MKNKKKILLKASILSVILLVLLISTGCAQKELSKQEDLLNIDYKISGNETSLSTYDTENPVVALYVKNYGSIVIELYPTIAPNTVANFVTLTKKGFYDGLTIHRVVPGFVIQGGDPDGNGTGGPGYTIRGEFKENGFPQNDITHDKGVISMARASDPNSAGSQFFIVLDDSTKMSLDNKYAGFGKVIEGMDVVEEIAKKAKIKDSNSGSLKKNIVISKVTVDTFGEEYKVKKH